MNLAVFDIDGTLLDNLASEDECFLDALRAAFGIPAISSAWESYQHVSDQGVAIEAYQRHFGSPPSAELVADTIGRFVNTLRDAHHASPLAPIVGAMELLHALQRRGWAVALATGAWEQAAQFKLAAAGIDATHLPIATSDDGPARVEIMKAAIARAERAHDVVLRRHISELYKKPHAQPRDRHGFQIHSRETDQARGGTRRRRRHDAARIHGHRQGKRGEGSRR